MSTGLNSIPLEELDHELNFIVQTLNNKNYSKNKLNDELNDKKLIDLLNYHRVHSLLHNIIIEKKIILQERLMNKIKTIDQFKRKKMLGLASELLKIAKCFENLKIEYISLKGPALSQLLYHDPNLRTSRDLDLLIKPAQLELALKALTNLGYILKTKNASNYLKFNHDVTLYHSHKKIVVELHFKLFPYNSLNFVSIHDIFSQHENINISGHSIHVLPLYINYYFLLTHAMHHRWKRLQWVQDTITLKNIIRSTSLTINPVDTMHFNHTDIYNIDEFAELRYFIKYSVKEPSYSRELFYRLGNVKTLKYKKEVILTLLKRLYFGKVKPLFQG